jgi:uncharacterized protein with HEPN domain
MFDRELVLADLKNIVWALDQIQKRFAAITVIDDFTKDDIGLEKLDSICMQLINIGEVLKHIDKLTSGELLVTYPEIDWKKVKGLRDIITHHYFDIDAETIFSVCEEHLAPLKLCVSRMISHLEESG